jgi:hypothetical protein
MRRSRVSRYERVKAAVASNVFLHKATWLVRISQVSRTPMDSDDVRVGRVRAPGMLVIMCAPTRGGDIPTVCVHLRRDFPRNAGATT